MSDQVTLVIEDFPLEITITELPNTHGPVGAKVKTVHVKSEAQPLKISSSIKTSVIRSNI